jgi:hypothetical protein
MRGRQHSIELKAIFVSLVFINLLIISDTLGVLSLYTDGSPASELMTFGIHEQLPTLGIHSDNTGSWHGYALSSDFTLSNGQIDYSKVPTGNTSITPYNEPRGYEMITDGFEYSGVQFTADMSNEETYYMSLITLWDAASTFDVPVDTLYIWQGGDPGFESGIVEADADGPYQVAEGGSVMLDATDSTYTLWFDDGQGGYVPSTFGVGDDSLPCWSINYVDIAFGLTPSISYDTLVNGLGLGPGIYNLTLNLVVPMVNFYNPDIATATIEVIPEPGTFCLLALGSIALLRKRGV